MRAPLAPLRVEHTPWPGWDELAGLAEWRLRSDWLELYRRAPRGREVTVLLEAGGAPALGLLGFEVALPPPDPRLFPLHCGGGGEALVLLSPDWRCRPAGPLAADGAALAALLFGLERHGRARGLAAVALHHVPDGDPLAAAAGRLGWRRVPLDPWCDLDVRWRDLEGYRATLDREQRRLVRRDERALAAAGVTVDRRPLEDWAGPVLRLRLGLVARYGRRPDETAERACLARVAGREHLLYGAVAGDRLLGFTLFVRHGDELAGYWTGRDVADPRSSSAYFATAFYAPAADAPALGIRRIRYGLGAWRAKRRCGCHLIPQSAWLRRL